MGLTGLVFVIAFATVCWLALSRHPSYGAALYVSMLFLSPQQRWWGQGFIADIRWSLVAALVTGIALLVRKRTSSTIIHQKSFLARGPTLLFALFVIWMAVQSFWAMDPAEHSELLSYYLKFGMSFFLLYSSLDNEESLLLFLRTYFACGFVFGWIAFTTYTGGRFEGFGGAGLGEANAGALALVTAVFVGAALFMQSGWRERAVQVLVFPFLLNGIVTTVSRSGFLALTAGGLAFLFFVPMHYRKLARTLAIPGAILLLLLAGPGFWTRMQTIKHGGEEIEGMDTGGGRLEIIEAQVRMFGDHPLGCGAMCTATLSPEYMEASLLASTDGGINVRASHNTFMSYLVEHGMVGAILYISQLLWVLWALVRLRSEFMDRSGLTAIMVPALAGAFAAMYVGDMFVSYMKFEPRLWLIVLTMILLDVAAMQRKAEVASRDPKPRAAGLRAASIQMGAGK